MKSITDPSVSRPVVTGATPRAVAGALAGALWLGMAGLAGFGPSAQAALGQKLNSVEADRVKFNAPASKVARRGQFSVHEMQAETGTTVREFVTQDGTVFAVAWEGPVKPDLEQLLGTYFAVYVNAPSDHKSRGLHQVRQEALVVQSAGRLRAFRGKAFVPALVPAGVTVEDIQ